MWKGEGSSTSDCSDVVLSVFVVSLISHLLSIVRGVRSFVMVEGSEDFELGEFVEGWDC